MASAFGKLTGYTGIRCKYPFIIDTEWTFDQAAESGMVAVSSCAVEDFSV